MKKCLVVVDFQNDFIDGALGFPEAISIKDPIIDKVKLAREENVDVIFTQDTHKDDYLETEEGKNLPVKHCVKGTNGHELHPEVKLLVRKEDKIFEKDTFPSIELGNYLKTKEYEEIELCGLVSNICVIGNAIITKSALPNAHIVVDALATDSADKDLHKKALDVMKGIHIEVLNYE
ncbi:MAG: cysteine hydrolase [Candidatus Izimaplasma sp.]|nr:cysteine hydrolase [Candidatus Izimaplasma bacterium]